MNNFAIEKFKSFLQEHQCTTALLTNPATLTWLSGYAPPIQTGPSPFEGGPAIGWWCDNTFTLLLSDMESPAAQALDLPSIDYISYTIDEPIAGFSNQAQALKKLLAPHKSLSGNLAIELNFLPATMLPILQDALPQVRFKIVDHDLPLLRAVKSPQEIHKIRSALAVADQGQEITRRFMRDGLSEIEIWGQVKAELERNIGGRLPMLADFVGGARTADIGGLPGTYRLQNGDAFIADLVPRLDGYWGDNAATYFVNDPEPRSRKVYQVVLETLEKGLAAVKPGVRAADLDALMRSAIQDNGFPVYSHHSGHGLGVTYHEEPRIVPYNTLPLQAGMIVALEPGIYLPGEVGVRLEDVVLVTEDGCEVLTHHLYH